MNATSLCDKVLLGVAIITPVPCIARWGFRGVFLGALGSWAVLCAAGVLLNALDPRRDGAILDTIWLLVGWVAALAYSMLIYPLVLLYRKKRARRDSARRVEETGSEGVRRPRS